MKNQTTKGTCPVCDGTCKVTASDHDRRYKSVIAGYDPLTDTMPCSNCGRQYMFGRPTGQVNLNKDGVPCTHSYNFENRGRDYNVYTCIHCGDNFSIDSGD